MRKIKPVRRRILGPETIINGRRRPNFMEQMINPTFLSLNLLLQQSSITFNGAGNLSNKLFLLWRKLKELLPHTLQTCYNLIWNPMVHNLKHPPMPTCLHNLRHHLLLFGIAQVYGGNLQFNTVYGGYSRLFHLRPNKLRWDIIL